jgi:hypothetical protein
MLTIDATTTETTAVYDQISVSLVETMLRDIDDAVEAFGGLITTTAWDVASSGPGAAADSVFFQAGLVPVIWDRSAHILLSGAGHVVTSTVTLDVPKNVAAVGRRPEHLRALVERSIVDGYASRGRRTPRHAAYTVEMLRPTRLRVRSDADATAEDVVRSVLAAPTGRPTPPRSIDRWPPPTTPYWAGGSLVVTGYCALVGSAPVTTGWLIVSGIVLVSAVTATLTIARRNGASVPRTALGMAPVSVILGFAIVFGAFMHGMHASVTVTTASPHLVDAFLLSFGIASTGGFLDLGLRGLAARVAAFFEMLLMVSVAGSSLYTASKLAWAELSDVLRRRELG